MQLLVEAGHSPLMEFTFLCLDGQLVLKQPLKNLAYLDLMLLGAARENGDIISVNKCTLVAKIPDDVVD